MVDKCNKKNKKNKVRYLCLRCQVTHRTECFIKGPADSGQADWPQRTATADCGQADSTPDSGQRTADSGLRTGGALRTGGLRTSGLECGLRTGGGHCGLRTRQADCGLRTADKRTRVRTGGLRTADCGQPDRRTSGLADCGLPDSSADCGLRTADRRTAGQRTSGLDWRTADRRSADSGLSVGLYIYINSFLLQNCMVRCYIKYSKYYRPTYFYKYLVMITCHS